MQRLIEIIEQENKKIHIPMRLLPRYSKWDVVMLSNCAIL